MSRLRNPLLALRGDAEKSAGTHVVSDTSRKCKNQQITHVVSDAVRNEGDRVRKLIELHAWCDETQMNAKRDGKESKLESEDMWTEKSIFKWLE